MDKNKLFRSIPKVDMLLEDEKIKLLIIQYGKDAVVEAIREELDLLREYIRSCESEECVMGRIESAKNQIESRVFRMYTPNMKKVFNATGTILHTNLGRAPLNAKHMEKLAEIVTGYSNLEYDLTEGKRGERYAHFEELLCRITGAEAALAVNNNAASVLLVLNTLACGGKVVVSRGELVEIGGSFRIPDVMNISRAELVEVGTTNKTHLEDYENAVEEATKAFLKVHTSNYKIVGFTESVDIETLVAAAKKYELPVVEDLGSGVLINLEKYGLSHEPTVQESLAKGVDVVCFSGDKLLGGPQAGIIVGKKKYIDRIKKNQLCRALRIDKFTAAVLELVLREYQSEDRAIENIPALRMITKSLEEVTKDAEEFFGILRSAEFAAEIEMVSCESQVGGGSLPLERISSKAAAITPLHIKTNELEKRMRCLPIPVISRIVDDKILLDVRTLEKENFAEIVKMFKDAEIFERR